MKNLFTPPKFVSGTILGIDGNAFSILGYFKKQAKLQGWEREDIEAVLNEAQSSSYEHLLETILNHTAGNYSDKPASNDLDIDSFINHIERIKNEFPPLTVGFWLCKLIVDCEENNQEFLDEGENANALMVFLRYEDNPRLKNLIKDFTSEDRSSKDRRAFYKKLIMEFVPFIESKKNNPDFLVKVDGDFKDTYGEDWNHLIEDN